jgi:nucleoside-diphosphate-sugar epimerase
MNILLTGHKGFIGRELYKRLSVRNLVIGLDLKDGNDLLSCTFPSDIDLVIHLAGKSGVRESLKNPGDYWINNVEASKRLFDAYKDTRILYASSSSQYEPHLNPYAASKHILERLAGCYGNTVGMRFHTVYNDDPREGMFFDKLKKGKLEYVTNHTRDFLHMDDCLDAVEILIKNPTFKGAVDIGSGHSTVVRELVDKSIPVKNVSNERENTLADISIIKSMGYNPKHRIPNGI